MFEGAARCECDEGYIEAGGLRCVAEQGSPCDGVQCPEHASCRVEDDQGVCVCDPGYHPEGEGCVADADPCAGVDCGAHGACVAVGGEPTCACDTGWHPEGLACVEDEDPCAGVDCGPHGSCVVSGGDPSCDCEAGWHPDGLGCVEDDPCQGVSCGVNAHCEEGVCVCDAGFEGDPLTGCRVYDSEEERIRQKLVDIAAAELGMCEGKDERPYMEHQPGYWCYDFVAWVYAEAAEGLPAPYYLPQRSTDDLPPGWRPRPGDLIKYTYQHYGMVESLSDDGTRVYTIEGNVNSCVMSLSTTDASVAYYGTLDDFFR